MVQDMLDSVVRVVEDAQIVDEVRSGSLLQFRSLKSFAGQLRLAGPPLALALFLSWESSLYFKILLFLDFIVQRSVLGEIR